MKLKNKGQLNDPLGLLITAALLFAVGILALSLMGDVTQTIRSNAVKGLPSTTTTNETVTWSNNTFVGLTNGGDAELITCSSVTNNATGFPNQPITNSDETINAGNWTCGNDGINLSNVGNQDAAINFTGTVLVTYSFKSRTANLNITDSGLQGEIAVADQFGNIGTVVGLVAIVALFAAFIFFAVI